jgi:hypothetical protein
LPSLDLKRDAALTNVHRRAVGSLRAGPTIKRLAAVSPHSILTPFFEIVTTASLPALPLPAPSR